MAEAPASLAKVRAACKKRGATGAKGLGRFVIKPLLIIYIFVYVLKHLGP